MGWSAAILLPLFAVVTWLFFWSSGGMKRADAIARLMADADRIRAMGVRHLYLVGSTARDEAGEASDVDILVEQDVEGFGILQLLGLRERLTDLLGAPADVTTRDGLHPVLRPAIEADAVPVF